MSQLGDNCHRDDGKDYFYDDGDGNYIHDDDDGDGDDDDYEDGNYSSFS